MVTMRVLVVDNERDSADTLGAVLMMRDPTLVVEVAYDGRRALPEVLSGRFQAVILDLMMPGMRGDEVARNARLQLRGGAPLLIALSGSVVER